ncbi:MAG: hypothetical protein LBQ44_00320 [Treponema sp.]|jgi:hypothetical protein|nr:hypothetical protein [Treponema sp.]
MSKELLLKEIDTLPPAYMDEVGDFVSWLKHRWIKETAAMERAAALAQDEYQNNRDLTAFSVLDGDDFYETR